MTAHFRSLSAAALLLATAALAKEQPPAAAPPKPFHLAEKREFQLENGLRVTLVPFGEVPKVALQLAVDVGNGQEQADQTWLADLTARLLDQGTATKSAEQLAQAAAAMGGQLAAQVTPDQTLVELEVLTEAGPKAVALLGEVVTAPAFPPAEVERIKGDLVRDLAIAKSQPQALAQERFLKALYPTHGYGRMFPTEELLRGYSRESVRGFVAANYGAARSHLYVAGRFDGPALEAAIRAAFSGWTKGPARAYAPPAQNPARALLFVERPGAVQSTLRVGLPTVDPSNPDWVGLQVTNTLLGGYFNSRMTANLREKHGYTYSPNSQVTAHVKDALWVQNADVTTPVTGASLKEIFSELEQLRAAAPPAAELTGVQRYMAGTFTLQNSSRTGIINQLRFVDLHGLPASYLEQYVARVLAVTPAQVQALAQKYLRPEQMAIVVAGDRKMVAPQLEPFGKLAN